jgi:hypothetical protein
VTTDPERLRAVGATDLERRLLEAAANERPSPELTRKMLLGLGLPGGIAGTAAIGGTVQAAAVTKPAAAATTAAAGKTIAAWIAAGVMAAVVAGGVIGGWLAARPAAAVPAPTVAAPVAVPAAPAKHAPVAPAERPLATLAPADARVRTHAAAGGRGADLRGEIALIDAARTAVRTGAPDEALALLRRYGAAYPAGTFRPEAAVLRIEALDANGEHARARALAREFVARNPESPLAGRVSRLAEDPR